MPTGHLEWCSSELGEMMENRNKETEMEQTPQKDPEDEHTDEVVAELQRMSWKPDYVGVLYTVCADRFAGNPLEIASRVRCNRWRLRLPGDQWQSMLQLGPLALPTTAIEVSDWCAVIDEMIEVGLLSKLTELGAEELERQYRESVAECTPLAVPVAEQVVPTEASKRELRRLIDHQFFNLTFSPKYSTDSGVQVLIVPDSHGWQLRCFRFADDCDAAGEGGRCRLRRVGLFWETPYHLTTGATAIECSRNGEVGPGEYVETSKLPTYLEQFRGECPSP